jgi:predicted amidohydrolase YtcJ
VLGFTKDTADPPGGRIERDANGEPTGILIASPSALILYTTQARGRRCRSPTSSTRPAISCAR